MAAGRLYPPIVNYAMPAFLSTESVRIYFSLSDYNAKSDIASIQLTVRDLNSNKNVLDQEKYPSQIKSVTGFEEEITRITQKDKYFIELEPSDIEGGFKIDNIYKIQLRCSSVINNEEPDSPPVNWLNSNLSNFSEWSTVTLIRPIAEPKYSVAGMSNDGYTNYASVDSIFTITYSSGEEGQEPLKAWRTVLYSSNKTNILSDSGWKIYKNYDYLPIDNTNSVTFESILPYVMEASTEYVLQLQLETRNGYTISHDYNFTCQPVLSNDFIGNIYFEINEEEGYSDIHVGSDDRYYTNLILRRTSSKSNFTIWEDVSLLTVKDTVVNWNFRDFTIESGIWYRYGIQIRDTTGRRGPLTVMTDIKMGEFENAFLLEENNIQLKLKYDFNISSANITISEAKTDTIGSKYPFVRRNGNMYYRTFQCSGLITSYMDSYENLFTSKQKLYPSNAINRYDNIRDNIDFVVNQYDYTYERFFREKVQEFLYDNKVKLFKSLQEGNILVKLMNISLTPKNELGRLLYSFSAQAVEIDEPTLPILQSYNIQPIINYSSNIIFEDNQIKQLNNFVAYEKAESSDLYTTELLPTYNLFTANQNLIQLIGENFGYVYENNKVTAKESKNNIFVSDFNVTYLRIEFESAPYLIIKSGGKLIPYVPTAQETTRPKLFLGWLVDIGNNRILVQPPNNIYELNVEDFVLYSNTKVSFPQDTQATIYYATQISQELDQTSTTPISLEYVNIIGQLDQYFDPNLTEDNVVSILNNKYSWNNIGNNLRYTLSSLIWADIEADPGTILYAQSSAADSISKFIINENGNLFLEPNIADMKIITLYFSGKQIDIRYLMNLKYQEEFVDDEDSYHDNRAVNKFKALHDKGNIKPAIAIPYDYYHDNETNKDYIYYNRDWCEYSQDTNNSYLLDIKCPVHAYVNYRIQQARGVYESQI